MSANTYTYTGFDPVSSGTVVSAAINDSGEVAGTYVDTNQVTHGFTDIGGVISTFDVSGASTTDVTAVSNGGAIVGYAFNTSNPGLSNASGFVAQVGSTTTIAEPGTDVEPVAVNTAGEVVGNTDTGAFTFQNGTYTPVTISGAESVTVSGVTSAGTVFGNYIDSSGVQHGFTSGSTGLATIDPAGSQSTTVAGVTAGGEIVGTYVDASGNTAGFTDINGTFTEIQPFGDTFAVVTGVNDAGTVVGYDLDANGNQHGFIDLGGVVDAVNPTGSVNTSPTGINNAGEIVGTYDDAKGVEHAFTASVTPSYTITTIDPVVSGGVQTVALNGSGEIVGTYVDANGNAQGFTDIAGTITSFTASGTASTDVTAVNASGAFVGFGSAGNAVNGEAFVDSAGTVTNFASLPAGVQPVAINAGGEIVGNTGLTGFVTTSAGITSSVTVTSAASTQVAGLNNAGEIVGEYIDSAGVQHGFTDIAGVYSTIDPAGSVSTAVAAVNAGGEVVGTYSDGTNTYGFTDINGTLTQLAVSGSTFTVATGVNDAGTVIGYATISGLNQGFVDDGGTIGLLNPAGSVNTQPMAINDAGEIVGTYADANGVEHVFTATTTPACYCPGTLIRTDHGEVAVEDLAIGDRVITGDFTAEPVRWIGRRSYAARFLRGRPALLPVRIRAGALSDGVPHADLLVSPAHALLVDGVLVPAGELLNGTTILRETGLAVVEYIHIELARHDTVWANGAAAETFVDDDSRAMFSNAAEYAALYGGDAARAVYCAERVMDGYVLDAIRTRLNARAGQLAAA